MNESFFNAAMSKLKVGTTSQEFAENYANASGEQANTDIWTQYKEEGLKLFNNRIDQGAKDGVVSEDEFQIVGFYVERLNNSKITMSYNNIEDIMSIGGDKNSMVEFWGGGKFFYKGSKDGKKVKEQKSLKPVESMSIDEVKKELKKRAPKSMNNSFSEYEDNYRSELHIHRMMDNVDDKNSNIVDMHIGTFGQGVLNDCTMLGQITNLSDKEIRAMIKKDKKSEPITYTIQFPMDKGTDITVTVTDDEANSDTLDVEYNGNTYKVSGFSYGDKTVKLLEMALIKRFGFNIVAMGLEQNVAQQIFTYPEQYEKITKDGIVTEEKLLNKNLHSTMGLKIPDINKGYENMLDSASGITAEWTIDESEREQCMEKLKSMGIDVSDLYALSDIDFMNQLHIYVGDDFGFTAILKLSDGNIIGEGHAYSVKSYDKKTKTVTINDPNLSNEDIKIPLDIAQRYFQISI